MKKRIITDNLNWFIPPHYLKGTIIKKIPSNMWVSESIHPSQYQHLSCFLLDMCVEYHQDWFEDIGEDIEEEKYKIIGKRRSIKPFVQLNKSIDKSQIKLIEQALNNKLFTKEDVILFAEYYYADCNYEEIDEIFNNWLKNQINEKR